MTLSANAAIPAGLLTRAYDEDAIAGATGGHAAGVLFIAPDGDVLVLRRSPAEENFAGHWALPGGGVDEGETPKAGALRECREEMGIDLAEAAPEHLRDLDKVPTPTGKVFHTFALPVPKKFAPRLNDEHTGYAWASLDMLPRPLHPAVEKTLKERLGEDLAGAGEGLLAWAVSPEQAEDADPPGAKHDPSNGQFTSGGGGGGYKTTGKPSWNGGTHNDPAKMETGTLESSARALRHGLKSSPFTASQRAARQERLDDIEAELKKRSGSATDSVFEIAMDRDSVREKTVDGRLIVKKTPISKANVCPYRGQEIPGWEALGLDPERIYNLLRDPEELRKAAPSSNGVQLLIKHVPVNADDHRPNETVGSLGTDAEFDGEYLYNSLFVNARAAIDGIESKRQRELSPGYHYKPDMTPGIFRGTAHDGVMRDIVFNHVAIVEDGRTGPDILVADEALKEQGNMKATRFGAMTLSITAAAISPLLAMDQKVTLPKDLFAPLTTKTFKTGRDKLLAGVRSAIDGKLRTGIALDASMQGLAKAIDAFSDDLAKGVDEEAPDERADLDKIADVEAVKAVVDPDAPYDTTPLLDYLRGKGMGEDDIKEVCGMLPKTGATDEAETLEEKAEREKREKEEKTAKDAEMKDMVTKPAMDAALRAQATTFGKEIQKVRESERGIRAALAEVHPWVGELPATMAFDSAADVFRHALVMKGVEGAKDLHADALLPILRTLPKAGARPPEHTGSTHLAMDSSAIAKATKMAPGLEHIGVV